MEMLSDADRQLCALCHFLPSHPILHVKTGQAAQTILDVATEIQAELIVVAGHEEDILDRFFGSTVDRVAHRAKCSVLIHRSPGKTSETNS